MIMCTVKDRDVIISRSIIDQQANFILSKVEQLVQNQAVSMARIDVNIEHIRTSVEKMADRQDD